MANHPDGPTLAAALGKTKKHWDALLEILDRHDQVSREWKRYGAERSWQLKASAKKRAVVYLIPHEGSFMAALALKEGEVARARTSALPASVLSAIDSARVYPEGRPVRVEVVDEKQAGIVKQLLAIRLGG